MPTTQNDFNMSDSQKHTSVESSKAALPDYNAAFLEFKKTEGRPIVDTIKQHSGNFLSGSLWFSEFIGPSFVPIRTRFSFL